MRYLWFFIFSSFYLSAEPMEKLPHAPKGLASYGSSLGLWVFLLLFFVVLAFLAFFLWKKFKGRSEERKRVNQALEVRKFLERLRPEEPFLKKQQESFFYDLGFNLRLYIELKMGLSATDLTYKELKEPLQKLFSSFEISSEEVLSFLEHSELIKFSQKLSDAKKAEKDRAEVLGFLDSIDLALQKKEEAEKKAKKGASS